MEVEIKYFNKGKEIIKKVDINIISAWVLTKREELNRDILYVQEQQQKAILKMQEIAKLEKDKPCDYEDKMISCKEELIEIAENVRDIEKMGFFQRRFDIIKEILEVNGVEEEILLNIDTWEKKMRPEAVYRFLDMAILKGQQLKKKE